MRWTSSTSTPRAGTAATPGRQCQRLAPWRCSRAGPGAAHVLELPAGAITGLQPGMQLQPWPIDAATANARFVRVADPRGAASAPPAAPIATT
ncbi:hypothetical protein [Verminephrobacter eiseniae]|uniref:hypothetical protein n=1 Tax=Verminephrobacter eiseniae TaxID=364317 RepID=UPI00224467C1|nr:hypothetical protein [Verminephrobacter eiseniae]